MTSGVWEYGVEHEWADGHRDTSARGSEKAARDFVANYSAQSWHPRPTRVMRRVVGEWQPLEDDE